jgi:uncharacterized protein
MIYRLEIENFCSIREKQILDLTIPANVPDPDNRYNAIFPGSQIRAPKVIALYGANASGKTTVLRALDFAVRFARDSASSGFGGSALVGFNNSDITNRPIVMAVELSGMYHLGLIDADDSAAVEYATYRYEISFVFRDREGYIVESEALRQRPNGVGKWQRVFERDSHGQVKGSSTNPRNFPISGYHHIIKTLPSNASLISTFAKFQHLGAQRIVEALVRIWTNLPFGRAGPHDADLFNFLSGAPEIVQALNKDLRRIDLGLEEFRVDASPNGPLPQFKHAGLPIEMGWERESHGTQAFIKVFPWLSLALNAGGIAIIDELDGFIHPLLLPEILGWFYQSDRNPHGAQIWLSCHSASLLDDLKKEEIAICEKDSQGQTEFFSLKDVGSIRRNDNLYKKYLSGVYGGVPHIG